MVTFWTPSVTAVVRACSIPTMSFLTNTSPRYGLVLVVRRQVCQETRYKGKLTHCRLSGNSLVDILYGSYNPSGRLPYTIAKNQADYPAQVSFRLSRKQG